MIKKLSILSLILISSTSVFAVYSVGDTVANFTLNDCEGRTVSLYDYSYEHNGGTAFVIMINFSEPWCGSCQSEASHLEQIYQDYGPEHFIILTIGSDWGSPYSCDQWINMYGLTFPVLYDNINLYSQYGDGYVPYNAIIDSDMVLRYGDSGFNQQLIRNQIEHWLTQVSFDIDEDGVPDGDDNCPETYNPYQEDSDDDGIGDACDPCVNSTIPGDVNGDTFININDIVRLVNIILYIGEPADSCEWEGGDCIQDNTINVIDIMWIVNHILQGKTPESHFYEEEIELISPRSKIYIPRESNWSR